MIFKCDRDDLINAIKCVSKAIPAKYNVKSLEGVLLETYKNKLYITGYNLEICITKTIKCDVLNEEYGEIVATPRLLSNVLKNMPKGLIEFSISEYTMTVSKGKREYSIPVISGAEYPSLPEIMDNKKTTIYVDRPTLNDLIGNTIYAVSTDNAKPIMTGEVFEVDGDGLHVMACDGFRLAVATAKNNFNSHIQFIVPQRALKEVMGNLGKESQTEWRINLDDKFVEFECGDFSIITRLIEGTPHNWRTTIPSSCLTYITVNKSALVEVCKSASLLLNEKNKCPLKLDIKNDEAEFNVKTAMGKFKDVVPIKQNGKDLEIGFNTKFFMEAINAVQTTIMKIEFNGSTKPVVIKDSGTVTTIHIVMPLQLKK